MIDTYNNVFVVAPVGVPGALFVSKDVPDSTSGSTENGVMLQWVLQTAVLPDNGQMAMMELTELQIKTSSVGSVASMQVTAQDQDGAVYNSVFYVFSAVQSLWGAAVWGSAIWGGALAALYPRRISFNAPVVFNRLALRITGASGQGFQIGDIYGRARVLGYMQATG